jgi:ribose 5-phosphate isomerase
LIRRDRTAAQRAKLASRRKAAYEAVHPETKHSVIGEGSGIRATRGCSVRISSADILWRSRHETVLVTSISQTARKMQKRSVNILLLWFAVKDTARHASDRDE